MKAQIAQVVMEDCGLYNGNNNNNNNKNKNTNKQKQRQEQQQLLTLALPCRHCRAVIVTVIAGTAAAVIVTVILTASSQLLCSLSHCFTLYQIYGGDLAPRKATRATMVM